MKRISLIASGAFCALAVNLTIAASQGAESGSSSATECPEVAAAYKAEFGQDLAIDSFVGGCPGSDEFIEDVSTTRESSFAEALRLEKPCQPALEAAAGTPGAETNEACGVVLETADAARQAGFSSSEADR